MDPGARGAHYDAALGRGLALLHQSVEAATAGWSRDNWIGSLEQENDPCESWAEFWRDRRLLPQVERADESGHLKHSDRQLLDVVLDGVENALPPTEAMGPHLLHGDLWGGNAYASASGEAVLVDPAVYRGHGEVDLAMSELFGGFGRDFYRSYGELRPISEKYEAWRRDLYQLYYLLVHVNLFGASYLGRTRSAAQRVIRAV